MVQRRFSSCLLWAWFLDLREAFDFILSVGVQCVLDGDVLVEEAVLGGFENRGRVAGEGAIWLPDCGWWPVLVMSSLR